MYLPRGLYAITPDDEDTARLAAKVEAAIAGGATAIQDRNKRASAQLRLVQAQALAAICRELETLLIVNDDAALADEVAADGVHVGEDDGDIAAARVLVGDAAIVGASCYNDLARARRLVDQGADYIAFGSFFASSVKPNARRADLAIIGKAKSLGVPVVAIGGITAANASALIDAGADAVAVISDVFAHDTREDIVRAAAAISALFER
jgi:thiamine-phosphate pyrophosphorylase